MKNIDIYIEREKVESRTENDVKEKSAYLCSPPPCLYQKPEQKHVYLEINAVEVDAGILDMEFVGLGDWVAH